MLMRAHLAQSAVVTHPQATGDAMDEYAENAEESPSGDRLRAALATDIGELTKRVDAVRSDLEHAAATDAEELASRVLRMEQEIAQKRADLEAIAAMDDPPLRDPQVLGWEATQGLVEYELVAGKDTLVRVFVRARPPVALPANVAGIEVARLDFSGPDLFVSRLDFASLEVKAPNGAHFRVPATMSGRFLLPSRSEQDNVNFYIDGDQLSDAGTYEFIARFYREGQPVGTNSLGSRNFLPTGDLRLLIKVNTWPMTDEGWDTVLMALEYLQRNLPVRAGLAPMDSDVTAGLRYYIDPRPYDPGWTQTPKWANAKLALTVFNLLGLPFGRGDRAHMLMNVREQQPGQDHAPGSSEGSGSGVNNTGQILGVQIRTDPPGGSDFFATVVGQEIGHNLIPLDSHTIDPIIDTASAFDLLNRRMVPEARTIMNSTVAGAGFANEICFYEPQHWSAMRKNLVALNS